GPADASLGNKEVAGVYADHLHQLKTGLSNRFDQRVNDLLHSVLDLQSASDSARVLSAADEYGHNAVSIIGRDDAAFGLNNPDGAEQVRFVNLRSELLRITIDHTRRAVNVRVQHRGVQFNAHVAETDIFGFGNHATGASFPARSKGLGDLLRQI